MDKIYIEGLRLESLIGVYDWERTAPRPLLVDLCMHCDLSRAAQTDNVTDTIDYALVAESLERVAEKSSFELLEALASAMLDALFAEFDVQEATLKLSKPDILANAQNVAVQLTRGRP
ncbi:dihydroneopterin aldolase [Bowmanella yangjiangensis]|uniref:7,8-dihydroneopterin aldolase n=1 Tax=Bowmanella yangjiangensis TaxID=2811230 RepID=A0ABS3CVI2_9ALTE|nr:dihydroneopterin aldolase [Bowmanella yangjiangensis]MBN7820330.1 dihydroneopterin aldolase [Bowmanella yangjiangensis]